MLTKWVFLQMKVWQCKCWKRRSKRQRFDGHKTYHILSCFFGSRLHMIAFFHVLLWTAISLICSYTKLLWCNHTQLVRFFWGQLLLIPSEDFTYSSVPCLKFFLKRQRQTLIVTKLSNWEGLLPPVLMHAFQASWISHYWGCLLPTTH